MNNDLISREALKEEFKEIYHIAETIEQLANAMEDAIDNAPTVDARHKGKIIKTTSTPNPNITFTFFSCSECNEFINEYDNFCPYCGADMSKGKE